MTLLPSMRTKEQLLEDEKSLLAEIERLKTDMRQAAKLNMELMEIRCNNEAEIEFLELQAKLLPPLQELAEEQRTEIERLRTALVADDLGALAYQSGWHSRDSEVKQLREIVQLCLDRYIPFAEPELRKRANLACGNDPMDVRAVR